MDQNKFSKVKSFVKKEGFYLVLFLCLCVIAVVSVVTMNINKNKEATSENPGSEFSITTNQNNEQEIADATQKQNADRVNNDSATNNDASVKNTSDNQKADTSAVSASTNVANSVQYLNPIDDAILLRGYTFGTTKEGDISKQIKFSDGNWRTVRGIDIKAELGSKVKAVANGTVGFVGIRDGRSEYGQRIEVADENGLVVMYENLDPNILVKEGDKVTAGQVIGAVGNTATTFTKEFGDHLTIEIFNPSTGLLLDPTDYLQLKTQ